MDASSFPSSSPDDSSFLVTEPGGAESHAPPPDHPTRNRWFDLVRWLHQNSFAPRWLPKPFRHSLLGYLVALLVQFAAAGGMLTFILLFPDFAFVGSLEYLGIVVLALGWGAGPSLCATLVGALLLYYALLPPPSPGHSPNPPTPLAS